MKSKLYAYGLSKESDEKELETAIEKILLSSTNNLSWLKEGETVLLKPALNSHDPYPATTHPTVLKVISKILEEKGAKVIVGDQSGIVQIVADPEGIVFGSSGDCYENSGMNKSGMKFLAFEDKGWNSFKKFKPEMDQSAWKDGFYITKLIDEVDHIINLPRVSSHIMGGVTLGLKNLVGLIREDSRIEFHQDGAFAYAINKAAKKSKLLKTDYEKEDKFFEKIAEISLAVKEKLRLNLFVATELQCTLGPDRKNLPFFKSYISKPREGLIFGSDNIVTADAFALAFLISEYKKIPLSKKLVNKLFIKINGQIKELGKENIWNNGFLKHALKLNLGKKNFDIYDKNISTELIQKIKDLLND